MGKKLQPSEDPAEEARREEKRAKRRAKARADYAANPEMFKKRIKKYAQSSKGRELAKANARAYYKANHEIVRIKANEYTRLNKDREYKRTQEWRERNKPHISEYGRAYRAAADPAVRKTYMRDYRAAADPEDNKASCKRQYAKAVAHLDAFKETLNGGHCNHTGCTIEWQACDIDHVFPIRKGKSLAMCPSIKNIDDEIRRNTDPDGTIQLQLLCVIHHRMKTYAETPRDSPSSKRKTIDTWKEAQQKCQNCRLTVRMLPLYCFDSDHLDRTLKLQSIAEMENDSSYTIEQVRSELEKCRMLCANCHRCHTAQQMGYRWADAAFWIMGSL